MKGGDDTGFFGWLKGFFKDKDSEFKCIDFAESLQEVQIRELAFNTAANMVSNAIGKCEFKTFDGGKEFKGPEYWRWNYAPNNNQNSSAFLHKWIWHLFRHNEALVIERAGQRLVADSFIKTRNAVREDVFSDINVEELSINSNFRSSNVIYLQLNNKDIFPMLQGLNMAYARLIKSAQKAYQWGAGRHGKLRVGTMKAGDPNGEWMKTFNELATKLAKPFLENENGVIPEFDGFQFDELGNNNGRAQQTTRDIRALIDDVYEITAKAFQIPPTLLRGDVQETGTAVDSFLTFCIDPLCDQMSEEINRKVYGYSEYLAGNYLKIDTTTFRHFDMFANATGVDKLISSGAFSINDVLIAAGKTSIDAPWANEHWITKNYETVKNMTKLGGDENGS